MGLNLASTFYLWVFCNQLFHPFLYISPSVSCSSFPGSDVSALHGASSIFLKRIDSPGALVYLCCNWFLHNCMKCVLLLLIDQVQVADRYIMLYFGYGCLTKRFIWNWRWSLSTVPFTLKNHSWNKESLV